MLRDETKAPILIHEHDAGMLTDNDSNLSVMSVPLRPLEPFEPDLLLKGHEKLSYAGFEIDVIPTPGHTSGGVCFLFREQKALFSGDTLFRESFGRYDFPDGSLRDLRESLLSTLFSLEGDFYVYPGHGDCTTLQHERERNPIRFY